MSPERPNLTPNVFCDINLTVKNAMRGLDFLQTPFLNDENNLHSKIRIAELREMLKHYRDELKTGVIDDGVLDFFNESSLKAEKLMYLEDPLTPDVLMSVTISLLGAKIQEDTSLFRGRGNKKTLALNSFLGALSQTANEFVGKP